MKQKWLELTRSKRILLLLQGFLILLFLLLYCTVGRQQVLWYENAPLRYSTDGEVTTYSGKIEGTEAVITVSPGPVVEFALGDDLYGPYSVVSDPSAVPDGLDVSIYTGVEVQEGANVLFRGAYWDTGSYFQLFDENGELYISDISRYGSDPTPGLRSILAIALTPEIVPRGSLIGFLVGALFCVACAFSILFADALFQIRMAFRVRNPEDVEPSGWELFGRWVGWLALTVGALAFFISGFMFQ